MEHQHIAGSKVRGLPLEGLDCDKKALLVENIIFQDVVLSMLSINSTTYFFCEVYNISQFHFHYNSYEILKTETLCFYIIHQLIDFQLLSMFEIEGLLFFTINLLIQIKHFISTPFLFIASMMNAQGGCPFSEF